MTTAIGGGVALQRLWDVESRNTPHPAGQTGSSQYRRAFLANAITSTLAVALLRWKKPRRFGNASPTLDFSLLLLVRALDALVQASLLRKARDIAVGQVQALSHDGRASSSSASPDTRILDRQCEDLAKEWKRKITTRLDALVF
ncbi:hypothetical protein JVU11DRAFT_5151 [Chiua virens]|nr:hypothetical protein JVU11DRAFT_5151 [Chiua virens]